MTKMKSGPSSRRTVPTCVTQALGCPAADAVNARNMIRFLGSLDCGFEEILYLYPEAAYFLQRVLSNYKVSDDDDLCSWSTMTMHSQRSTTTSSCWNLSIGTAQRQDS